MARGSCTRRGGVDALVVVVMVLGLMIAGPIAAAEPGGSRDLGGFHDAEDAERLDLADISLRFHPDTHRYVWRFSTYERFRLANGGTFVLLIDSVVGPRWDFRLYVWDDPGSSGIFCDGGHRPGSGGGDRFRPTRWDVKPTSGWCRAKGIRRDKPVRWRVMTVAHQGKPFGTNPFDRAPDAGWF